MSNVVPIQQPRATGAGQVPAHDLHAEEGLIGIVLAGTVAARDVTDLVSEPDVFFDFAHRTIWNAILAVEAAGAGVEYKAVAIHLNETGANPRLATTMLNALNSSGAVTSLKRARSYAGTMRNRWLQRRLAAVGHEILAHAYAPIPDVPDLLMSMTSKVSAVQRDSMGADEATISLDDCIKDIVRGLADPNRPEAMSTGLERLDRLLVGGLHRKLSYIIAARTSVGKTAFTMQLAEQVACDGNGVFYVSLEMPGSSLVTRMISGRAEVDSRSIMAKTLSEGEMRRFTTAAQLQFGLPVLFSKSQSMTLADIATGATSAAKRFSSKGKRLGLVVVDHIGLVKPSAAALAKKNREQEVAEVARFLKLLAGELDVAVIGLCQISRESEKDRSIPKLRHLRESGAIENDADTIGILHRPRGANGLFIKHEPTDLVIGKARITGLTGHIRYNFDGRYSRFIERRVEDDPEDT